MLVCFALLPRAQAVLPAPDGGYPGGNTAEGTNALLSRTSGVYNTATGLSALLKDTTGSRNTANGVSALRFNTTGSSNTAIGTNALLVNTTDNFNTAVGDSALFSNATGSDNTAAGYQALRNNTTGDANTAIGDDALLQNTSGFGNTALGFQAGFSVQTANNVICIGHSGSNVSNSCWINNIYSNVQPVVGTNPDYVTITNTGRLGRGGVSSRRYKHDIKPMDKASEVLFALKPVSFRYNKQYDATQTIAFGLIAEEVAEVYPDLVGRDPEGQPESVRYEQVNAMLLNEFLKEHRKVEEQNRRIQQQETTITQLKKEMGSVVARLKEQESKIQTVSDQLELRRPAAQMALNNQ